MAKVTVVTSVGSAAVRSGLAAEFMNRFCRYWPGQSLRAYTGEPLLGVSWAGGMPPGYMRFKAMYEWMCQQYVVSTPHSADSDLNPYDYRFDATRFAIKAYALMDTVLSWRGDKDRSDGDSILWLDSDVLVKKPVPLEFLGGLARSADVVYLDREEHGPECGFVLYSGAWGRVLIDRFHSMYESGEVFNLPEWHDSYVFGHLLKTFGGTKRNLAEGVPGKHPWPQTILGKYMTHLKGPARKFFGKDLTDAEAKAAGSVPLGDIV